MKTTLYLVSSMLVLGCTTVESEQSVPSQIVPTISYKKEMTNINKDIINPALLPILENVVESVENSYVSYSWHSNGRCNTGLVVQSALNLSQKEIIDMWDSKQTVGYRSYCKKYPLIHSGSWLHLFTFYSGINSKETNIPLLDKMIKKGINIKVVGSLEYLSDKAILQEAGIRDVSGEYYSDRENYIKYLKAWIRIIKKNRHIYA